MHSHAGGVAHAAAAVSIILLSASADGAAPQHLHSYAGTVDVVAVADLQAVVSDGFAGSAAYQVRVPSVVAQTHRYETTSSDNSKLAHLEIEAIKDELIVSHRHHQVHAGGA